MDFLNTIHDWKVVDHLDRLADFSDVAGFAVAAGLLRRSEARRLAECSGGGAELRQLRQLRTRMARVFQAVVASAAPDGADLDRLARDAAHAAEVAQLRPSRGAVARTIALDDAGLEVVRWRIVEAAVALLTSERLRDVKACPNCGWFFVDTSKNRSRRWCSMRMCGSGVRGGR